ncbi:MAG: ABC transporter ATP-binding protein [Bacillota bacterium]
MPRVKYDIDDYSNREMNDTEIVKRLLTYVKPFIKPIIISSVLVLLIVGLDLLGPIFISIVLDSLAMETIPKLRILLVVITYLVSLGLLAFTTYKQRIILQITGQKIIYNIRRDVFNHIETLSIAQFNKVPIGKFVTRVSSDIDKLNMLYTDVVINVLKDVLMIVGVFVVMSLLSPRLTLWLAGLVPIIFIASYIFRRFSRKAYRKVRRNVSIINAFLSEHLSGMKLIQIFNREEKKYSEFKQKNTVLKKSYYQQILTFSLYRPFMYMLYILGLIIVLWQGSGLVLEGYITFGVLFAFTQYVRRFFQPIQNLAAQFNTLQSAFTSGERIFDILDTEPDVQDKEEANELTDVKGKIEFKNVWFAYNEAEWNDLISLDNLNNNKVNKTDIINPNIIEAFIDNNSLFFKLSDKEIIKANELINDKDISFAIEDEYLIWQDSNNIKHKLVSIDILKQTINHNNREIEFEIEENMLRYRYLDEMEWVLKDVSFVVEPNQTLALVGATGSGKTTIITLIARNYDIQKGKILIDDIDIRDVTMSSLRKHIGQMLQDVFLFSGTIESNIRLRNENITDKDVLSASKYVNADKFIQKLPNKYDEIVRERGNNFSSGQRQLLSFARTVVHKPQIMILDEATANIDTETEMLIQESLKKIMSIGTMIIVAHRLSTIQHADNIIVMQKGKIIERGNHQELLKLKGHYYQLYRLQYDKSIEDANI